jgi:hypothetical protein
MRRGCRDRTCIQSHGRADRAGQGRRFGPRSAELLVSDVAFLVVTIAIFVLLGVIAKGVERL